MDYVSDGERSKVSFMEYPSRRISGFAGPVSGWIPPDIAEFQEAQDFWYDASAPHIALRQNSGPVQLLDAEAVGQDTANLRRALSAASAGTPPLVGKQNLVASTDCGFGTFLGRSVMTAALAEAKLTRLA